jgi:hypothetical protein
MTVVLQEPTGINIDLDDHLRRWLQVPVSVDVICGDALGAASELESTRRRALRSPWRAALLHIGLVGHRRSGVTVAFPPMRSSGNGLWERALGTGSGNGLWERALGTVSHED